MTMKLGAIRQKWRQIPEHEVKMKQIYCVTTWSGAIHERVTVARLFEIFRAFMKPKISIALQPAVGHILNLKNQFISLHRLQNRYHYKVKSKTVHITDRGEPQCYETSRLPHFLNNRLTDDGEVLSLTHWPPFTPRKIPGTHFC
jgi:hypothetical protein